MLLCDGIVKQKRVEAVEGEEGVEVEVGVEGDDWVMLYNYW